MTRLTILTPTWNRRHLLPRLFTSLAAQAGVADQFDWLVIDDGSTDGTAEEIARLQREAGFPVRLIVQDNGGKHRALNRAVPEVTAPWVVVLDSDDWMLRAGIGMALAKIQEVEADPGTLAIVSPKAFADRTLPRIAEPGAPIDYATWQSGRLRLDFSMVIRTETLRQHPFPEFEGEGFIAESSVYARAFAGGGIRLWDRPIMGAEYQPGGLSDRSRANRAASPLGAMHTYRGQLEAGVRGGRRIRCWINYRRYLCHARSRGAVAPGHRPCGGRFWDPAGRMLCAVDRLILRLSDG